MAKFSAELRAVLKAGDEYSCHSFLQLKQNGELYYGPCGDLTSEFLGKPAFRGTHHHSGVTHLYFDPTGQRISEGQGTPTGRITGIEHLGANSSGLNRDWSYTPKNDTSTRRTLILDLAQITVPSFTVEAWACARDDPALWDEILAQYSEKGAIVLGHIRADWCEPNLALIAWSFSEAAWRNAPLLQPDERVTPGAAPAPLPTASDIEAGGRLPVSPPTLGEFDDYGRPESSPSLLAGRRQRRQDPGRDHAAGGLSEAGQGPQPTPRHPGSGEKAESPQPGQDKPTHPSFVVLGG